MCAHAKLEENFNKAYGLTMDDGNEVIAKIPSPIAGPPSLTTASGWLRRISVPEVYTWNSDPANPVGTEYIIMEKVPGIALSTKWAEFATGGPLQNHHANCGNGEGTCTLQNFRGQSCSVSIWGDDFMHVPQPVVHVGPWFSLEFALSIPQREVDQLNFVANWKAGVQKQLNQFDEKQSIT